MVYTLSSSRILAENSRYAPVAVVRLELDLHGEAAPGFSPSLMHAALSEIGQHGAGGEMFPAGTESPLETCCELALKLQRYAGHEVAYSRVEARDAGQACRVFIEYEDHATALYAADLALDLVNAVLENPRGLETDRISAFRRELNEYLSFALARRPDPNARLLKDAARQLDIPAISLDPPWGMPSWPGAAEKTGIIQYGWGKNQRQCRGALPLGTLSPRQIQQCLDRAQWLPRLKEAGVPIANQDLEFVNRNKTGRAQRSARRIAYPVTVRPRVAALPQYGLLDTGAFGPLENDGQVALVASYLREQVKADVWVESFVPGAHYRFLVLGDEVVSVLRFSPPAVAGDGVRTIAGLARAAAQTAGDAETHRTWQRLAKGDANLSCRLQCRGLNSASIPAPAELVTLRGQGTVYNGGAAVEVLDQVPAGFHAVALRAAAALGLQALAGIDLLIGDLQGSAEMPNCAVTGVDPVPDLVSHSRSSAANRRRIPAKFFSQLFPRGQSPRIPAVSVTGTNGKTTTTRMIAGILRESGMKVGFACSDGVYLDDEFVLQGDEAGVLGANEVLFNPEMEVAVLETARGAMASMGLAFDQVDVGACLNVADDHLGHEDIETLEQMASHKRQVIERSRKAVVLNAEDSRCLAMREHTTAKEVILFAYDPGHPEIAAHIESGGCAVVVADIAGQPTITLKSARDAQPVMALAAIPATGGGSVLHNVYNALAAAGVAQGLGISIAHIAGGLTKFRMGINTTPGRLNAIPGFSFEVLVDAAHNPHGIRYLVDYVDRKEVKGRKIVVFGARKTLSEQTIQQCSALLVGSFDLYVLRNYRPGEPLEPGESSPLEIVRRALLEKGVPASDIVVVPDVLEAVDRGIECAEEGDLLVVQVPAGGNDKWKMIDRIKGSPCRAREGWVNAHAVDLAPTEPGDADIKLLLCGDVMLGRGIDQILPSPGDPRLDEQWRNIHDAREFVRLARHKHGDIDSERGMAYVWGEVLPAIEEFAPDLRLVNLETAITADGVPWPQKPMRFRMNPENIDVLKHAQVDFCALANNHVMDWSRAGLEETIQTLDRAGIRHAGAGPTRRDAERPVILEVPGKGRVIAVSMGTASSGIPGAWAAGDDTAGLNLIELRDSWVEDVRRQLADIKRPGDILVVSIHWGGNYEPVIPQNQREFARRLIDEAGVDIVHGHSSHHVRGIEVHNGKLILYGCGDLVNDYEGIEKPPERQALAPELGLLYCVRVSPDTGRTTGLRMIPTTMRNLRVVRGGGNDAGRLAQVLNRECVELGTVVVNEDGILRLKVLNG